MIKQAKGWRRQWALTWQRRLGLLRLVARGNTVLAQASTRAQRASECLQNLRHLALSNRFSHLCDTVCRGKASGVWTCHGEDHL